MDSLLTREGARGAEPQESLALYKSFNTLLCTPSSLLTHGGPCLIDLLSKSKQKHNVSHFLSEILYGLTKPVECSFSLYSKLKK